MIEIDKLREKNVSELKKIFSEEKKKLATLRINIRQGTQKDLSKIKKSKLLIAKVLTVIKEQEVLKDGSATT